MSDRDLLEAAARAAGYTIDKIHQAWRDSLKEGSAGLWLTDGTRCWNPLTDDGDALRLAGKLRLLVGPNLASREPTVFAWAREQGGIAQYEASATDPCAATRRAIVHAAAALTQPEGGA